MEKGTTLLRVAKRVMIVAGLVAVFSLAVQAVQEPRPDAGLELRADLITIDSMKAFGTLERAPVIFQHDRHTEAMAAQDKNCSACHPSGEKRQSQGFKRLEDPGKEGYGKTDLMNIYHDGCISCHREATSAGLQTGAKRGPVTCGNCHREKPTVASNRKPMGMDKSLHYRHTKALKDQCKTCHHVYNPVTKTLQYEKGKEGTCRYCHRKVTEENRISTREASHIACIECHLTTRAKNESAGPIDCSGCHDLQEQKLIMVVENVPRMEMKQPDVVYVKRETGNPHPATPENQVPMGMVPFDHKGHEAANNTCRVCHHADLNACAKCHTVKGTQEGGRVQLAQSMHLRDSQQSCIGCHDTQQKLPECAGCHTSIQRRAKNNDASCLVCHFEQPSSGNPGIGENGLPQAEEALQLRRAKAGPYPEKDIPEIVEIKGLSNQYGPVALPHRKIVNKLQKNIERNRLAGYFHREAGTLCQGCQHNSPPAKNPPKCASCHGEPFDAQIPSRPGLMAAYHQQCMECHSEMAIQKPVATDCVACHKENKP